MREALTIGDARGEAAIIRRRLALSLAIMAALVLALLARLFHLQIAEHEHYQTRSRENRVRIEPIAPTRGLVFSRNGVVLAENRPSFSLAVTPERVQDLDALVGRLGEIVTIEPHDRRRFEAELANKRRFENVTLRAGLSPEDVARFSVDRHRFPGASIAATATRHYPAGELYAHVVGYVGRIDERELDMIHTSNYAATRHIGKTGIESTYENALHGEVGYQQVEVNAQGRIIRVLERSEPRPGQDVYLTVDADLQRVAQAALEGRRGAVVAMDVVTGGILAMVSAPSFDPNLFVEGIRTEDYRRLRDSPDRPLFNRALQGQYPPGSTIKPFVAMAGLVQGVRDVEERTWCPGWYSLPGDRHRYRDWKKTGHGHVDLHEAIAQSCDVYFYDLAHDLGIGRLASFLGTFGFGSRTGIDVPGEAAGLVPSAAWKRRTRSMPWFPGETLITGIGQGFMLATPVQLAVATAALARRGSVIRPYVVGQLEDPIAHSAAETPRRERAIVEQAEPRQWDTVIAALKAVVHGPTGTARRAGRGAAVEFAGKTGTAQLFGIAQGEEVDNEDVAERLRDHALFIAFAPADSPEMAVAVIVENGGSGSRAAAPLARRLIDSYFGSEEMEVGTAGFAHEP